MYALYIHICMLYIYVLYIHICILYIYILNIHICIIYIYVLYIYVLCIYIYVYYVYIIYYIYTIYIHIYTSWCVEVRQMVGRYPSKMGSSTAQKQECISMRIYIHIYSYKQQKWKMTTTIMAKLQYSQKHG